MPSAFQFCVVSGIADLHGLKRQLAGALAAARRQTSTYILRKQGVPTTPVRLKVPVNQNQN